MDNQTQQKEEIYPIAVLIDELKNDDKVQRLNSIRRLNTIATALGEKRTRDELIPYLCQSTDDEDEVLMALADELGKFVVLVGGPTFAHCVLKPLEQLATVEETVVREKAVESLNVIGAAMQEDAIVSHFVPLIKRLASGEWFSTRVSACGLFAVAYQKCPIPVRRELRESFTNLCRDETPMVRRAAAQGLGPLVEVAEAEMVRSQLMELFSSLVRDEQDSVRLITVESCPSFALVLSKDDAQSSLIPLIQSFAQDESWRVRYNVSQQMVVLCKNLGEELTRSNLVQSYARLLQDNEAEVRVISAGNVSQFSKLLDENLIVTHIVPCVKDLAQDSSQLVRSALASVVMELAPSLGRANTIDHLIPIFLQLLRDQFADVRLNVISKLEEVNTVVGIQLLTESLLPAIEDLSKDKHWRVRMAILEKMSMLAAQLGVEIFENRSEAFQLVNWLDDQVASIRDTAATELQKVAKVLGPDWTQQHLLPHLKEKIKHPHYLNRITILKALAILIQVMPKDQVKSTLLPVILKCAEDTVPNVRFNVAKLLIQIHQYLDKDLLDGSVKNSLKKLINDNDVDVKYFAQEALDSINGPSG